MKEIPPSRLLKLWHAEQHPAQEFLNPQQSFEHTGVSGTQATAEDCAGAANLTVQRKDEFGEFSQKNDIGEGGSYVVDGTFHDVSSSSMLDGITGANSHAPFEDVSGENSMNEEVK